MALCGTPTYYAEDRAPLTVELVITTGTIAPASVVSAVVKVRLPNALVRTWTLTPTATTATTLTVVHTLEAAGLDAPAAGTAYWESYLYGSGDVLLGKTPEQSFEIGESRIPWPTA